MILEAGSNILLVHRRLFQGDQSRYFIGKVFYYDQGVVKVRGYSWMRDTFGGNMIKKNELRTKIFSIISGSVLTYQIPDKVDVDRVRFQYEGNGRIRLTDNAGFEMDMSEMHLGKKETN